MSGNFSLENRFTTQPSCIICNYKTIDFLRNMNGRIQKKLNLLFFAGAEFTFKQTSKVFLFISHFFRSILPFLIITHNQSSNIIKYCEHLLLLLFPTSRYIFARKYLLRMIKLNARESLRR